MRWINIDIRPVGKAEHDHFTACVGDVILAPSHRPRLLSWNIVSSKLVADGSARKKRSPTCRAEKLRIGSVGARTLGPALADPREAPLGHLVHEAVAALARDVGLARRELFLIERLVRGAVGFNE